NPASRATLRQASVIWQGATSKALCTVLVDKLGEWSRNAAGDLLDRQHGCATGSAVSGAGVQQTCESVRGAGRGVRRAAPETISRRRVCVPHDRGAGRQPAQQSAGEFGAGVPLSAVTRSDLHAPAARRTGSEGARALPGTRSTDAVRVAVVGDRRVCAATQRAADG